MSDNPVEPSRQETGVENFSQAAPKAPLNIPMLIISVTTLLACLMILVAMLVARIRPASTFIPPGTLAPDLAADFPIYGNASVLSRTWSTDASTIVLVTGDKPEAVKGYYVEQLTQMGWYDNSNRAQYPDSDYYRLDFSKTVGGDCRLHSVDIITQRQDEAMTRIKIEYSRWHGCP